jgi:putative ABC transport system substrate-binding protein
MRRRDFIKAVAGSVAASPLAVHAQQRALSVVGLILPDAPDLLQAFRQGLKETGYVEHENIAIEFRPVQNQPKPPATMSQRTLLAWKLIAVPRG